MTNKKIMEKISICKSPKKKKNEEIGGSCVLGYTVNSLYSLLTEKSHVKKDHRDLCRVQIPLEAYIQQFSGVP